jgi:arsenite methyltransferase
MAQSSPCSLTDQALQERLRHWSSLRNAEISREQTATGAVVRYRLDPGVAQILLELLEAERRCCPSLALEAAVELRFEAPESMRAWVHSTFGQDASTWAPTPEDHQPPVDREGVEEAVRGHYAAAARRAARPDRGEGFAEPTGIGASAYPPAELEALPEHAVRSSIGCANPVAVADLRPGDIVVDLGSGGGMDVLLSARRVGPTGRAYGFDMTEEMLELARRNQAAAGIDNAEFLRGRIEAIPLPNDSVDVVLSNCVIALSTDKVAVFSEAYRILRPRGRLAIADVVTHAQATPEQLAVPENWVACVAGSLTRSQYRVTLEAVGFVGVSIDENHSVAEGFDSVTIRATKPGR